METAGYIGAGDIGDYLLVSSQSVAAEAFSHVAIQIDTHAAFSYGLAVTPPLAGRGLYVQSLQGLKLSLVLTHLIIYNLPISCKRDK